MTTDHEPSADGDETVDHVADLVRWERSGAVWRVLERSGSDVTIGLFSCDGGEQMDRVTSHDPALLDYVRDRTSSDDD
jgi:hypothetical protein